MFKCKCKCGIFCKLGKVLLKICLILFALLAGIFAIFFFDLDGKLLFYVVEPFLKKHYDDMERKDTLKDIYEIAKPNYEYDV